MKVALRVFDFLEHGLLVGAITAVHKARERRVCARSLAIEFQFIQATAAAPGASLRKRLISFAGALPKKRLYSRLVCDALTYPTPIGIGELATLVNMSVTSFHR